MFFGNWLKRGHLKKSKPALFILIAILSAPYGTLEIQSRRLSPSLNCILFSAWLDFIGTYGGTYTSAILSPELYSHSTNHIANISANQKTSWKQIYGSSNSDNIIVFLSLFRKIHLKIKFPSFYMTAESFNINRTDLINWMMS